MTIETFIEELADLNMQIKSATLAQLSGLLSEDVDLLRSRWDEIEAGRREEIITRAVELAEDNVVMDFHALFIHCLFDQVAKIREKSVQGLWDSDNRRNIIPLTERLYEDDDPRVRAAAAIALGHFASLAQEDKLMPKDSERVTEALMSALEDQDEDLIVRRRALESVSVSPEEEVRRWIDWAYSSDDSGLRSSAVFAMGRTANTAWLPVILKEMDNQDPSMRYEAANAGGELGEEAALPRLSLLAGDSDSHVQIAAVNAIANIGGVHAKKILRDYAKSEDDALREMAEEALALIGTDGPHLPFRNSYV